MDYRDVMDAVFYGNTLAMWGVTLLTFVGLVGALVLARRLVARRWGRVAAHTATWADDLLVDLLRGTRFMFLLWLLLQVALKTLALPANVRELLSHLSFAAFAVQLGLWASRAVTFWLRRHTAERAGDGAAVTTIKAMAVALKVVAWIVVGLLVLENLDFDVTTLVAGLGITGIAVALAVQNLLSDLFGALSIVLDKPFVIGDFIVVDNVMGTVERIGLKTTRLRSLSGEQIIVSNADLLKSRIRNFKRMYERRVVFNVGVDYATPPALVARIPTIIREAVTRQPDTRFDRSHFGAFMDIALNVETVYYVLTPDYNRYMDIQQAVNLEILRRFEEEGIAFAVGTRRVVVSGGELPPGTSLKAAGAA